MLFLDSLLQKRQDEMVFFYGISVEKTVFVLALVLYRRSKDGLLSGALHSSDKSVALLYAEDNCGSGAYARFVVGRELLL